MTPEPSQEIFDSCERSGRAAFQRQIDGCAKIYDRIRHLPSIIRVTDDELTDFSVEGHNTIIKRLEARADALPPPVWGAWHDHHEHAAIRGALKAENRMLLNTLNAQGLVNIFARAAE